MLSEPATTWLLVRMWPSLSITNPEPVAVPPWDWPNGLNGEVCAFCSAVM